VALGAVVPRLVSQQSPHAPRQTPPSWPGRRATCYARTRRQCDGYDHHRGGPGRWRSPVSL
jgi:hypothetical protein